ncbi:MAG: helix-turn-helix domain-containing protein [Actinomycetes bacterium]
MSKNASDIRDLRLLSAKEVQRIFGVSWYTLMGLVQRGELPAIRVNRRWRFDPRDVEAYLERRKLQSTPQGVQLRLPI